MGEEHLSDEALAAWSEGSASADQLERMTAHVASCDSCRTVLSELSRTTERPPTPALGRYELREKVGAGGMGTVWSAWDPKLGRRVALKVAHARREGPERFFHERQILAGLEHPHIARLLDAGETEEQRPWFAMDFIDGLPIDQYCAQRDLGARARVELMLPVLAAVQHAHRHLVVHRDLKPANILVDAGGRPHLVDFGIARVLERDLKLTQTGHNPMTPAWASPEQVRGESVTTSTDVFSLGVVLYELLSGASPWRVPAGEVQPLLRAIEHDEPLPCSRAATTPARARELEGDLDAVVAMALRKDPKDRYRSVDALADDLRAWLEGNVTLARRGDRRYRLVRFVRRHRLAVAAAAAVFASLTAGLAATAWQAQVARAEKGRAERRFTQVRALAHAVLFDYHDGIADLPGSTPLRERLVKDALGYLDSLAAETQDDRSLQQELAFAYLKVGDVQGDPFGASLGDTEGARQSYLRGRALAQAVLAAAPMDRQARRALASSEEKVGALDEVGGKLDDAAAAYARARALGEVLAREQPDDLEQRTELSRAELALGQVWLQLNKLTEAREVLAACVETRRAVLAARRDARHVQSLAKALNSLADVRQQEGHNLEAIAAWEEAVALFEEALRLEPDSASARRGRGVILGALATANLMEHRYERAVELTALSVKLAREQLAADPQNAVARRDVATALLSHGHALSRLGRVDEALAALDEGRQALEQLAKDDPTPLAQRDLVACRQREGYVALDAGRHQRGLEAFTAVRDLSLQLLAGDPQNAQVAEWVADGHYGVGSALRSLGRLPEALEALRASVDVLAGMVRAEPDNARLESRWGLATLELAQALDDAKQRAAACTAYREAAKTLGGLSARGQLLKSSEAELGVAREGTAKTCR